MDRLKGQNIWWVLTLTFLTLLLSIIFEQSALAEWNIETVDSTGQVGFYTSLELDSSGYAHISYYDDTNYGLKYAWKDGSGWHTETVESDGRVGEDTSLELDDSGYPHISYYHDINGDLKYAWKDGSSWHTEIVDSEGDVGSYTSLELDDSGYPHISYKDGTNADLKYAWKDGSGWHTETVDSADAVGDYTSLELDDSGYPHISYGNGDLKYAWKDGSSWHTEIVDSPSGVFVGHYTSLKLDDSGYPHISYSDDTNADLKYAWKDGSGWHTETVDSTGQVGYTSLELDSSGYAHISYYDDTNYGLKYAWKDGSGWHTETVESSSWVGKHTSLKLDDSGYPHISYLEWTNYDRNLKYAYYEPDTTPPTPNPMTWSTDPHVNDSSIDMVSTTASDPSGVEYYFDEITGHAGGDDSGWQDSTSYTDSGLSSNTQYCYRVKARDKSSNQNETGWSSEKCATTSEITPPNDPTNLGSPSHQVDIPSNDNTVKVTWTKATDPSPGSGVDGYGIKWDNNSTWTCDRVKDLEETVTSTTSPELNDGSWYFHICTKDNAGNWTSTIGLGPFVIDTNEPALITDFSTNPGDGQCTLSWTNRGDNDLAEVLIKRKTNSYPSGHNDGITVYNNTSPTPGSTVNHSDTGLTNGATYYYAAFSRDLANNWNDAITEGNNAATCTPSVNQPPASDADGPYSCSVGDTINLDGSGSSDSDGNITDYNWDYDNDGQYDDATGVNPSYSCSTSGTHTIGLRVTDDNGATDTDSTNTTVEESTGDVNNDGQTNVLDARICLQGALEIISLTSSQQQICDVDEDGDVDKDDAVKIAKYSIGVISSLGRNQIGTMLTQNINREDLNVSWLVLGIVLPSLLSRKCWRSFHSSRRR